MAHTGPGTGEGLVLGGDIGGTSTRIVLADLAGRVVARAEGAGGNPVAHPATAHRVFAETLAAVTADREPAAVRRGVIGMAGSGAVSDPDVRAAYDAAWRSAGLPDRPVVCPDLEVAFAAGTEAGTGSVLIAGTGAVAGRVRDHRLLAAVGGHGWLLGDEGSGFWIGREAVRAALRSLEGTGAEGTMTREVLREMGVTVSGPDGRTALIAAAHAGPPVGLSGLSPLVARAHASGDRAATAVLDAAVAHLLGTWQRLGDTGESGPVVLAGSLTDPTTYVGSTLRRRLDEQAVTPCTAGDPVVGAVRIALRGLEGT